MSGVGRRLQIAFLGYHDVFEDFYPHYGVSQEDFVHRWDRSANHVRLRLLQEGVGDVTWYELSRAPEITGGRHETVGCQVVLLRSSWLHRLLWRGFYQSRFAWRLRPCYAWYAPAAAIAALLSWQLWRRLLRERPDVLFVQDYAGARFDALVLIARLLRVPLIAWHTGGRPENFSMKWSKGAALRRAARLILSSSRDAAFLQADYGVAPDRMEVVLTPIDLDTFRPRARASTVDELGLDPNCRYLLFVGRLDDAVKRASLLISLIGRVRHLHPDVRLLIVGDGPDREPLVKQATDRGLHQVSFLGWQETARLVRYYSIAECLCLPSRSEGFPAVVAESMACGTPVVGFDVGGVSELLVPGVNGWLVPAGDDAAFGAAIEQALDGDRLAPMRSNARALAETRLAKVRILGQLQRCFSATP